MRFIAILAIALLTCTGRAQAATATDAAKDCHLKRLASIDLRMMDDLVLVPVTLQGKPALMALNIGT